jgi:hypothetical protein
LYHPSATNILVLNGTGVDRAEGFIRGFLLNPTSGALTPNSDEAAPGGAGSFAYYAPKQQLYVLRWNVGNANYVLPAATFRYGRPPECRHTILRRSVSSQDRMQRATFRPPHHLVEGFDG